MSHATILTEDVSQLANQQIRNIQMIRDAHAMNEHEAWKKSWDWFWVTKAPFRRSFFSLTVYGDEFRSLQGLEALADYAIKAGTVQMLATGDDMKLLTRRFS